MNQTGWAAAEFAGARLPDGRFRRQLVANAERLATHCGESFSSACGPAGRQAARRLLTHPETHVDGLLAGHYQQTAARCAAPPWVFALHDTTPLDYKTHPRLKAALGPIASGASSRGLLLHTLFLVTPEGLPLGLLDCDAWSRDRDQPDQAKARRAKTTDQKESGKWLRALAALQQRLPESVPVLVIADRESDLFDYLAAPRRPGVELLVRAGQDRLVRPVGAATEQGLVAVAAGAPVVGQRTVTVPRKPGQPARDATLTVRLTQVEVPAPRRKVATREPQRYGLVQAAEEAPPEGVEPLCWVLLTTLDLSGVEDPGVVCEYYARRWRIEDFHRTLKSGLGVEELQIESPAALCGAVALLAVVAWQVMHLTWLGREQPDEPAEAVLAPEPLAVLRAVAPQSVVTVAHGVREIARLGGYEPYRGAPPPGVQRVWRGLRRLNDLTDGWRAAVHAGAMNHG